MRLAFAYITLAINRGFFKQKRDVDMVRTQKVMSLGMMLIGLYVNQILMIGNCIGRNAGIHLIRYFLARPRFNQISDVIVNQIRTVTALTRWANQGAADEQRVRKVIGVLEQIGGTQAEAFLELQADAGDDPEVQTLAKETLQRLRQRGGGSGSGIKP